VEVNLEGSGKKGDKALDSETRLETERQEIQLKVESRRKYNYLIVSIAFPNVLVRSGQMGVVSTK